VLDLIESLSGGIQWIDLLDILIVAYLIYRALFLIKGTRAMQMLTGLGVLGLLFFLASSFRLFATYWILSSLFNYFIIIVIVLFQDDMRRALTHVGKTPFLSGARQKETEMASELAKAAFRMARENIGALIVVERETGLANFMEHGSELNAYVKAELLYSIFLPAGPIHDGAIIISQGKIASAGCVLPLSKNPDLDKKFGTRHRAAIGVTEETDALVVLVSEESGDAMLVQGGRVVRYPTESEMREDLTVLLNQPKSSRKWKGRLKALIDAKLKRQKTRGEG
jgi:diadenylate cyclase